MYRLEEEQGIKVKVSEPIVVYRESVQNDNKGRPFEGKSPNRHNRFYIETEPLPDIVVEKLRAGEFKDGAVRSKDAKEVGDQFAELGMDKDMMRKIYAINGTNVLVNDTKGFRIYMRRENLSLTDSMMFVRKGPVADEPLMGVLVRLVDAKLHEDAIHRGPAQTIPAVRNAVKAHS